jgi:predicted dehydrogenase
MSEQPAKGRGRRAEKPTVALIGCGAITEALHLPALSRHPDVMAKAICVDPNLDRATAMATKFGAARAVESYEEIIADIDGAIVAVPPSLHYRVTLDLVNRHVNVLCEKPLTETAEQARQVIATADLKGAALCVNNYRRLYPSSIKTRKLIENGDLGTVRRFEFSWGEKFDWPAASGSYFGLAARGRGVLADKGSHLLDLACWWLGGKPSVVSYEDDSMGGTEAVATLKFQIKECEGLLRLSWLSRYENTFEIKGDRATVTGHLFDWNTVGVQPSGSAERRTLRLPTSAKVPEDLGSSMIDNFLDVLRGRAVPLVAGSDVLPSIELIDECYARRQRMPLPWYDTWRRVAAQS